MKQGRRQDYIYTAGFCEENIWWLARSMVDEGYDINDIDVLYYCNSDKSILVFNQRARDRGQPMLWDYHVVLQLTVDDQVFIYDLDTRLDFPSHRPDYLRNTFPVQSLIPRHYRTWVRCIPAQEYVRHFCSDRSHMKGQVKDSCFPGYPPIQVEPGVEGIDVSDYWNMQLQLPGCSVEAVDIDESSFLCKTGR
jgi:hypothetical protein